MQNNVYMCVVCGAWATDLTVIADHIQSHHTKLTPVEEVAIEAIAERVKQSPEWQEHYGKGS